MIDAPDMRLRNLSPCRLVLFALLLGSSVPVFAQGQDTTASTGDASQAGDNGMAGDSLPERKLPVDMAQTQDGEVTILGKRVRYRVTLGTQPVYGEDDRAIAALQYTYYERRDVDDLASRPLFISFNGGPGSGSLWMHLGYTSPKQLRIDD